MTTKPAPPRWAIDEIGTVDPETGLGTTVGYVQAQDQQEAMRLAGEQGLFGTGFYSARPADPAENEAA